MKVRLKTDFWKITEGELTLEADTLCLRAGTGRSVRIPLPELQDFSIYNLSGGVRRFRLETAGEVWEGFFRSGADSSRLLQQLCSKTTELQFSFGN